MGPRGTFKFLVHFCVLVFYIFEVLGTLHCVNSGLSFCLPIVDFDSFFVPLETL